ncbi:hypothetical protein DM02DRAFT_659562 [Periconia macrospinosa]|uniref:Uncharacterized protein n=1 Tax=Periconia macrospinosa TaxID=97972 RepID=A0A2V1DDF7_9PLEO|nr:hypothetical protein DM02DRAFT_659562 [Periconia macrospinosa]
MDINAWYTVWLVESNRICNKASLAQIPVMFGFTSQKFGVGVAAPISYFFVHINSPISNFKASDSSLTDLAYSRSILPLMLIFSVVPIWKLCHA